MSKSALGRDALRKALRTHPDFGKVWTKSGRDFQLCTVKELYAMAYKLNLDPRAIYAAAAGIAPAVTPTVEEATAAEVADASESEPTEEAEAPEVDAIADAIESEVRAIRDAVTQRGFSALDERLRELVSEARKPPITVYLPTTGDTAGASAGAVPMARPTGKLVTWQKAFDVGGSLGRRTIELWDGAHPDTPEVDPLYLWPANETQLALTQIARGHPVFAFGPAGTGKTEFAQQIAARLGRPFALVSCDASTDAPTLVGMTVPKGDTVAWQDGQLTRAIQIPGCVILLDEASMARPGALAVLHNVLAKRVLWIAETGRRVPVAHGVLFLAADNTNGLGGGARRGYTDTQKLNLAFLDRFGARVRFNYLPAAKEAHVIASRTGCTSELAELLVKAAELTRAAADQETITNGIGLRRLMAWAECLTDGVSPEAAFEACVLNAAPDQDKETLRQQCALAVDRANVSRALKATAGTAAASAADPALTNPTEAGRRAASDFALTA